MTLNLTENAKAVLEKRYLIRDASGAIAETPEALFRRVARFVAQGDSRYGKSPQAVAQTEENFYELMASLSFLPNSPTLMNAGKPNAQLSACFVLPVEDSLEGIFETLKHTALIHQSGGGTGFSFSRLRPKGDRLAYTSGVTSGPISFMEIYNAATEAVKQGGTRRGANMGILRIDHPDIEEFITVKNDLARLTNFNISVAVTDTFMQAVQSDGMFELVHPKTQQPVRSVSARALMEKIVMSAWQTGEPGLIFIDRINADNVTPVIAAMEATNPCGEVPLLPYEACNLGSINLNNMLRTTATGQWEMDWERFRQVIHQSVHFLDNVISQNTYPVEPIRRMVEGNRKIGLGLMGWADILIQLGISYNSEQAIALAQDVMAFINYHSKIKSMELAQERGAFPFFSQSEYVKGNWFSQKHDHRASAQLPPNAWEELDKAITAKGLRNATTTCLAPTGTISIIAGASGGIEPLFALAFTRNIMENTRLMEVNRALEQALQAEGLYSERLMKEICNTGGIQYRTDIPEPIRRLFVVASEIEPRWHVRMQAAFQKYSDNAVSKTINFAESAGPEQIKETYRLAYDLGLKGITVYRNNSRQLQPMKVERIMVAEVIDSQHCPECKQPLQVMEGCLQCPACQYAVCG